MVSNNPTAYYTQHKFSLSAVPFVTHRKRDRWIGCQRVGMPGLGSRLSTYKMVQKWR